MRAHVAPTYAVGLVVLALAGSASGTESVRGPYLQQLRADSVRVVVELDEAAAVEVRYGIGDALEETASAPSAHRHELTLEGLESQTEYGYEVWIDGEPASVGHGFTSAALPGEPVSFIVFGDTRSNPDAHDAVASAIGAEAVDLLVHTGDLVADGSVPEQWDEFFAIEAPLLSRLPLYPVVGNHDDGGLAADQMRDAFALPDGQLYYGFDHGNVHLTVLDGYVNIDLACLDAAGEMMILCFDEDQLAWIEQDLADAVARPGIEHLFVFTHEGPFSSKPGRTGSAQMRALLPLFEAYDVRAIVSGHDHYYERGWSFGGIPYVITGGGGAPLYDIGDPSDDPHTVEHNEALWHYLHVDVGHEEITISARDTEGVPFDELVLTIEPGDDDDAAGDDDDPSSDDDASGDDDDPGAGVGSGGVPLSEFEYGCGCRSEGAAWPVGAPAMLALLAVGVFVRRWG